jgi:glucosylceramidase
MTRLPVWVAAFWIAFAGAACSSGPSGSTGSGTGTAGTTATGQAGTSGAAGDTGSAGTTGAAGDTGSTVGAAGSSGSAGAVGTTGSAGTSATSGSAGSGSAGNGSGNAGTSGAAGRGGTTGSGGSTAGTGGTAAAAPLLFTSAPGAYWKPATATTVTTTVDMMVTDTTTYQTWDGFGGAFNEMGWDNLQQLSATDRDSAIKLLFDATDGAHFVFGRIPIGASDYAVDRYTLDETANDYTMASFSIARDQMRLIPFVKAALAINPNLRLWASPWTPPTWMKTTSGTVSGASCALTGSTPYDGGCMKDDAQTLQALALYLVKFVQAYGQQNIKIEAIHHQNEPGYATGYPSCLWSPALYTKFIGTYLGPTFASMGVTASIYLGTMSNNDSGKDGTIITMVNADATASKYIKGFGLQWNMLPVVSTLTSKNLPILQTEHKCGNYPWETATFHSDKAPNDHAYGIETWGLIRDWLKANVTSYSSWNMVLDTIGMGLDAGRPWPQNALLTVDRTAKKLTATPAYYVFRHFSQYVAPGAKRVAVSGSSVDALAFKNPDGSIVAVMYNSGTAAKTTTFAIGSARLQFSVPASGFATIKK